MKIIPRIAITPGDLAGVGPDLCLHIAEHAFPAELIIYSDQHVLAERAEHLQLSTRLQPFEMRRPVEAHTPGVLKIRHISSNAPTQIGQPNHRHAPFLIDTLRRAIAACRADVCQALVTGPVCKSMMNAGGVPFTGHTEYLAEQTESDPVMMLATPQLRVALVTTHLPLSEVSRAITPERLRRVIRILHHDLIKRFGCRTPVILVAGLNPHAGEDGHLGREEIDIIRPTLAQLNAEGIRVEGPLPADTLFLPKYLARADAVLAMYHDQGLPVLKYSGFHEAINITLGLPIIRTSVDHGTAFDLAGTGEVDTGSMLAALRTAISMAQADMA